MKNINILSPINSLGYGQVGKNITLELAKIANVSLGLIGGLDITDYNELVLIRKCIENGFNLDFGSPCIRIWHQHDMSQFMGRGIRIGFPIFELNRFSDLEVHHLSNVDHLFVCSEWAKNVLLSNGILANDLIHVVPLGVVKHDFTKPNPMAKKDGITRFFTCGKWEIRKGHDIIIEAFSRAFEKTDDVEMYMMCTNPFLDKNGDREWKNKCLDSKLGSKFRFVPRVEHQSKVIQTMSEMDCGIFISRAEGWNLELLEMMSCGKPVIATNYSGHTEFCNEKNSLLVNVDELEMAYDGIWFNGKVGEWAKLGESQIDQVVGHMRNVHNSKFINTEGIHTAKKFTWENSAREVLKHVEQFSR
jgi:glycosyltransferase involved in cell wall biosynthesis